MLLDILRRAEEASILICNERSVSVSSRPSQSSSSAKDASAVLRLMGLEALFAPDGDGADGGGANGGL